MATKLGFVGRPSMIAIFAGVALASVCGSGLARAQDRATEAYLAATGSQPTLEGPVAGAWRYQLLRRGCPHRYPMLENAQCATASGGPAGGIN